MTSEFMIIVASMVKVEQIVEEIKSAAEQVMMFPDDKDKMQELEAHCMMFILNRKTKGSIEGAEKTVEEFQSHKAKLKLFEDSSSN